MIFTEDWLRLPPEARAVSGAAAPARLRGYLVEEEDYCPGRKNPAVILCPGGGYAFLSSREGEPVAREFLAAGVSVFLLSYACAPEGRFPLQLLQAAAAVRLVRERAEEWKIDPQRIFLCGFSAGGHLCGCLGAFWSREWLGALGFFGAEHRPDGLILCYPVLAGGEYAHEDSFRALLGEKDCPELRELVSLDKQVAAQMPPVFLWHTFEDQRVPVRGVLLLCRELVRAGVPLELHLYPRGLHGLSLANPLVSGPERVLPKVQSWIRFAKQWIAGD